MKTPINRIRSTLAVNSNKNPQSGTPRDELLQLAHAVHDEVLEQVGAKIWEAEARLKSTLDTALGHELGRRLDGIRNELMTRLDRGLDSLRAELAGHSKDHANQVHSDLAKSLGDSLRGELKGLVGSIAQDSLSTHFKSLSELHQGQMKDLKADYDKGLDGVRDALSREKGVVALLGKMLKEELQGDVSGLLTSHEARLKELQDMHVREVSLARATGMEEASRNFDAELNKHAASFGEALNNLKSSFEDCFKEASMVHEARLRELHEAQSQAQSHLLEALKQLPAPVVEFNPHVSMPDQPAPVVNVNVPHQESIVHVAVPEQKAPDVHVTVPRRKTRKLISYDQSGRPSEIVEEEIGD